MKFVVLQRTVKNTSTIIANMKLLGKYKNGNYTVKIFDDGTKIRETEDDEFIPAFSENSDCKLTDKCSRGCPFCYEGCTPDGLHAQLDFNSKFFDSLHPYTELAINGNDMDHPQLREFLEVLKEKKIIANITLNQNQLENNYEFVKELQENGLVYGIGVSLNNANDKLVDMMHGLKNTVLHTICGILSKEDIDFLKGKHLKVLILGYKDLKRGHDFKESNSHDISKNREYLYNVLHKLPHEFDVISFDNLAIEQLNVRRIMSDEEWNEFYMGDDGHYTFYVDLVKKEFAKNSLSETRYPMEDLTIDEMFSIITQNN